MIEVIKKPEGPRGGEIFKKTPEEKIALKKAKAEHKKWLATQGKKK
jgi:hypothetical protein